MAKGDAEKFCFVISPIGGEETATRKWADQTIKHLIRPAVEPHGLTVKRADEEDRAGIITTHIIQRLVSADLVVADLTWRNPNVFYELAVRHVTRKPLIQIIRAEEEIPFDVQAMRTVKFELNDPDTLEVARQALGRQVEAVLEEEELETPISQAVGQLLALESGDPAQVEIAELARAVQALTAEVRGRSSQYIPAFRMYEGKQAESPWTVSEPVPFADFSDLEKSGWRIFRPADPSGADEEDSNPPSSPGEGGKGKRGKSS
jgi:uncharacterized protein (UPF0297 family)